MYKKKKIGGEDPFTLRKALPQLLDKCYESFKLYI